MRFKYLLKRIVCLTPKWLFNVLISLTANKKQRDDEESLESYYPDNGLSSLQQKRVFAKSYYDLKIIIPCYNAEKYVAECVDSLLNQATNYKIVIVLVNDGSTDDTLRIIKEYSSDRVVIIDKQNGGSASARNKALETVESEFTMFVDSDDLLLGNNSIEHMLDLAYKAKKECDGDIIIEFYHSNSIKSSSLKPSLKKTEYTGLSGFAWAKVFSTTLFSKVGFPEGYWFEDTVLPTIIYPQAKTCFLNKSVVYFYRPTENSMTIKSTKSRKTLDTFYVTKRLLSDREETSLVKDYNYFYRFYMQVICNAVRLKNLPVKVQIRVFFETIKLFEKYSIVPLNQFKELYKSLDTKNFERYLKFCSLYTKMYLNL